MQVAGVEVTGQTVVVNPTPLDQHVGRHWLRSLFFEPQKNPLPESFSSQHASITRCWRLVGIDGRGGGIKWVKGAVGLGQSLGGIGMFAPGDSESRSRRE